MRGQQFLEMGLLNRGHMVVDLLGGVRIGIDADDHRIPAKQAPPTMGKPSLPSPTTESFMKTLRNCGSYTPAKFGLPSPLLPSEAMLVTR
jgi:hypothetical protein